MPAAFELGKHTLPNLPYGYDALEPYIDAQTLQLHHDKHHLAYINGLNEAELGLAEARKTNDYKRIAAFERAVAFHGSGHVNHTIYWNNMKPKGEAKAKPEGALLERINLEFGGFDNFQKQFNAATANVEGNGWGAFVYHPYLKRFYTLSYLNHQNLSLTGAIPLLLCDVWEHAYYLKYQNRRADYITNWWSVVDWADVEKRFQPYSAL